MQHLIQERDGLQDYFNLPSIGLCGTIFFPTNVDTDKCPKCMERLELVNVLSQTK